MSPLAELLVEVSLASPEAYENYLAGEGDHRERLHGLAFDLDAETITARQACRYDDVEIFESLQAQLADILA